MPGPSVVVCQGDTVVAEIVNKLHTETTTIHWHGKFFLNVKKVMQFLNKFSFRRAHEGESIHGWDTTCHSMPNPAQRQVCHEVCCSGKIIVCLLVVICKRKIYKTSLFVSIPTYEPEIQFVHRFLGLTSGIRTCLSSAVMGPSVAMLSDRLVLFLFAILASLLVLCSFC